MRSVFCVLAAIALILSASTMSGLRNSGDNSGLIFSPVATSTFTSRKAPLNSLVLNRAGAFRNQKPISATST